MCIDDSIETITIDDKGMLVLFQPHALGTVDMQKKGLIHKQHSVLCRTMPETCVVSD